MAELKRVLRLTEVVFFGVGTILGAGVYALIGKVAGMAGNLIWLSFCIAALAAMCTAFSYAELSAAFPRSGGEFVYAKKAFGKRLGTFVGLLVSMNSIIGGATVAIGFGGYMAGLIDYHIVILALGIVMVIFVVNALGIKASSVVNMIFTSIEIGGLCFVVYTAWPSIGSVNYFEAPPEGINGVFAAAALAFFAYVGFEEIVKLSEETQNPEKVIPRALMIASIIVLIIYTLVAISIVSVIPYQTLGEVENPLAVVVGQYHGRTGILAISIIALFATANTILSNMLGSSRVILDMSNEVGFLKSFSPIWKKRQTPVAALLLILVIMSCFVFIGKIETVATIATSTIFFTFLIVNLAVLVLRKREPGLRRPYRIPVNIKGYPVFPMLGATMSIVLLGYNVYSLLS
ncbi:MAG: amino acid permease [Bacteroidia bacterium]|nr:amino acid permease [Bacteroidia bacterium]